MSKSLVIVESPAKAKTINKFLGTDYFIKASMGHIKDLPLKELGVDINNEFKPHFTIIKQKRKIVKEIVNAAKKAKKIFIATDPDREGEAIAYHIATEISPEELNSSRIRRVTFNEITREAVNKGFSSPGPIDMRKVEAQQARRILDRLVGYKLSPLLWRKVGEGLSAGRVQSVAVRLICEREEEIKKFKPEEYWTITARLQGENPPAFLARLENLKDAAEKLKIKNEDEAKKILKDLEEAGFVVVDKKIEQKRKFPPPPFITSTLQQEAVRTLGFTIAKTMRVAQALYEGIPVGEEGPVGLITYMRTDSVRVAEEAMEMARKYIREKYGDTLLPLKPPVYKSRKGAQEAHEAIRPTSVYREPEKIKQYLTPDQYRLYKLIWDRFVASQAKFATLELTTVEIEAGNYLFKATGTLVKDKGFLVFYGDRTQARKSTKKENEEESEEEKEEEQVLPEIKKGEVLKLLELTPRQSFTRPPPRYTEATLVKVLEEKGIGRPSTYAPIIQTIQQRRYVVKEKGKFYPTELGRTVNALLVENFPVVIDTKFTAHMEEELDRIEEGKTPWIKVVKDFYGPFSQTLHEAQTKIEKVKKEAKPTGEICPECGSPIVEREGRFGSFLACSSFPRCRYTKSQTLKIPCPNPGCNGEIVLRRTRKGRIFYGCSNYPKCKFMSWQKPANTET